MTASVSNARPGSMSMPAAGARGASGAQIALGMLFALTGALIATSLFSIGDSGVPIFCLAFLLPVAAAPFAWEGTKYFPLSQKKTILLISITAVVLLLGLTTFFQIAMDRESAIGDLTHAVIRLSYLVYFGICIVFLKGQTLQACMRWLRRLLTLFAFYGIYQLPAKLLGLPLFLDWLRNNPSFGFYDYNTAGWVNLIRATSVYAEPSQCTVPIIVLILLNVYLPAPRWSKWMVWIAVASFAVLTFSRMIWIAGLVLAVTSIISRFRSFQRKSEWGTLALATALVAATLVMPMWAFYSGNYKADLSRQERAGSIVIGLHLVGEHPWIGSGWNSYKTLMPSYQVDVEGVNPIIEFDTIHNMFVSYAEQAGVAGFVLGMFPFFLMLYYSEAPNGLRLGSILSLLSVAELGGDVAYSSLYWLWVAIVLVWPAEEISTRRAGV